MDNELGPDALDNTKTSNTTNYKTLKPLQLFNCAISLRIITVVK